MSSDHEDTPEDKQDSSRLFEYQSKSKEDSPLEKNKSENEKSASMNHQKEQLVESHDHVYSEQEEDDDDDDDETWNQQQVQREREEVLYSLYESHNTPTPLSPNVMPGRKMVHLMDQASKSKYSSINEPSATSGHRRSKYAKSMPNLHLASSVSRLIDSWSPHGTTRSKSCSHVEEDVFHDDSLASSSSNIVMNNNNNDFQSSFEQTPSFIQQTLTSSLTHSIHVLPTIHIKQQHSATWMPGVTYLPLLVIQYACHPFYVIWKNLSTDSSTVLLPKISSHDENTVLGDVFMLERTEEDSDNHDLRPPLPNHVGQHHNHGHHRKHHHHHHHHKHHYVDRIEDEKEYDLPRAGVVTNAWRSIPLIFTQNTSTSTPSYIPGGDLFVE